MLFPYTNPTSDSQRTVKFKTFARGSKKRIDAPDLILKGNINRFYGKAGINELGWITIPLDILWFFGLPIQTDEGMVDITMQLSKADGTLVGEYNGKYEYLETFSMYNNPVLNVPSRLNKAFSEAIKQIREKIWGCPR